MDFLPSDEQQQLVDSVRACFAEKFPIERLRPERIKDDGGRAQWTALGELGYFGLGIAESAGGSGCGLMEEILLLREAGRYLVTPALSAQMLALHMMVYSEMEVSSLLRGTERAALVAPITADLGECHLFDAEGAHWLIGWLFDGVVLRRATTTERRAAVNSIDGSVPLARVVIDLDAEPSVRGDDSLIQRAILYVAAQLVGISEAARDMATQYAKTRVQFGQPIGVFQAIKHRCADMAVRSEAAWCQTVFAALSAGVPAAGRRDSSGRRQNAAALLLASTAAQENAAANIQVHGGMGYTAECDAHHFVKRARILERLAGGTRPHQKVILSATDKPA